MNAKQNTKSVHSIEQELSTICMSARMGGEALHDARLAGKIVDGIAWVCGKFTRHGANVFATPSPQDKESFRLKAERFFGEAVL